MKFGRFHIFVAPPSGAALDTTRPGWRQRFGDIIHAARGQAGIRSGTDRATPAQMSEYYGLLPKLTITQIKGLLSDWMSGNWSAGYDLTSLMLDTWPVALKNQHEVRSVTRRTQFTATPYRVGDDEPSKSAEEKSAFINHSLENFRPTPGTDERGWGGTVYGVAGAVVLPTIREVLWLRDGTDWRPYATSWAHPRTYGTVEEKLADGRKITRLASRVDQGLPFATLGTAAGQSAKWLPMADSIVSVFDTRDGACTLSGLIRPLAFWWGGMMYGREWLLRYAEMFGQPLRVGYYANGIKPDDLAVMKAMLGNMGSSAWAALPEEVRKLEFIEAKGTGADNPQRFMIEHGDKYCDLLFKGETSAGGNYSGGQREQADFRKSTRTGRDEAYADWCAETLREQLVREIIRRNWGTDDETPFLIPDYTEKPDRKEQAAVISTWLQNYDLAPEDAAEISGLPLQAKAAPAPTPNLTPTPSLRAADATPAAEITSTTKSKSQELLASALAADLAPVRARLETILALDDDAALKTELKQLQSELPKLIADSRELKAALALERLIGTALLESLTEKPTA